MQINSGNVTYFETVEQFSASEREINAAAAPTDAATAVGVEVVEGDVPMDQEEGEEVVAAAAGQSSANYELYSSFWRLQRFFASESKVVDKAGVWRDFAATARRTLDLLEGASDAAAGDGADNGSSIGSSNGSSSAKVGKSRSKRSGKAAAAVARVVTDDEKEEGEGGEGRGAVLGSSESADAYMGCKFLTSSQVTKQSV